MATAFQVMKNDVLGHSSNRPEVADLILFLTDGFPNPMTSDPRPVANELKQNGVRIFGLAVTDRVNETVMQQVSSPGDYLPVKSYRALASEVKKIIKKSCRIITTTPPPRRKNPCTFENVTFYQTFQHLIYYDLF